MSISVTNSNFTPVYFKHASNAGPGVVQKCAGSNLCFSKHSNPNSSKVSANWAVSAWT